MDWDRPSLLELNIKQGNFSLHHTYNTGLLWLFLKELNIYSIFLPREQSNKSYSLIGS